MSVSPPAKPSNSCWSNQSNEEFNEASPACSQPDDGKCSSLFSSLLQRMNPRVCLGPITNSAVPVSQGSSSLDSIVPSIVSDIQGEDNDSATARTEALQRLYNLTDLAHKQNRVPLVCTNKWDIVETLATAISIEASTEDRRLACLTLNNLSIPFECKAVMVLAPSSEQLLSALCAVIRQGLAESYLCCICLFNLSFLEDAVPAVLNFCPSSPLEPLDDPFSLLRTIELMMETYSPILSRNYGARSVEGEAVRWATGLIRNLTAASHEACFLISQTKIPEFVCSHLENSSSPLNKWTKDSMEDLSLMVLCNLAKFPESLQHLKDINGQQAVKGIVGQGGIHDFRATMVQCSLESI